MKMICDTCKDAADLWTAIKDTRAETISAAVEKIISGEYGSRVEELHQACKGRSWCDCQHKIVREAAAA